jgi:hypothetical protein
MALLDIDFENLILLSATLVPRWQRSFHLDSDGRFFSFDPRPH